MILFPEAASKECGNIFRTAEVYVLKARVNNPKQKEGYIMKGTRILLFLAAFSLQAAVASAENARISIVSPADNERVERGEEYQLVYEVTPGPGGDHFHVWVDGQRGPGIHDSKGVYTLPKFSTVGEHDVTIKVVDKGHIPTGPQKSIKLNAQ